MWGSYSTEVLFYRWECIFPFVPVNQVSPRTEGWPESFPAILLAQGMSAQRWRNWRTGSSVYILTQWHCVCGRSVFHIEALCDSGRHQCVQEAWAQVVILLSSPKTLTRRSRQAKIGTVLQECCSSKPLTCSESDSKTAKFIFEHS